MTTNRYIKVHDEDGVLYVFTDSIALIGEKSEPLENDWRDSKGTIHIIQTDTIIQTRETIDEIMELITEAFEESPSWK